MTLQDELDLINYDTEKKLAKMATEMNKMAEALEDKDAKINRMAEEIAALKKLVEEQNN